MNIEEIITEIRNHLKDTFARIDCWFDKPEAVRNFRPEAGRWTIEEVLEHIALTNHFLLILIDKGAQKAINKATTADLKAELEQYVFHRDRLDEVGIHQSFSWIRPEHMEPKGEKNSSEVRAWLNEQLNHCLDVLEQLKNGEGILYKTTMSVNALGKIDVYEYLYFLSQHGIRHIAQMQKNKNAFPENNS